MLLKIVKIQMFLVILDNFSFLFFEDYFLRRNLHRLLQGTSFLKASWKHRSRSRMNLRLECKQTYTKLSITLIKTLWKCAQEKPNSKVSYFPCVTFMQSSPKEESLDLR